MEFTLDRKLKIGISACTYGAKVRYNSKGWDMLEPLGREKGDFIWHPLCPEVLAGLGVIRDSIRISGASGSDVWNSSAKVVSSGGKEVTKALKTSSEFCIQLLKEARVDAFIYMEGSPSCGVYRTTLKDRRLGKPPGVFGHKLLEEAFFLIPAADLQSPIKWWDWRRRLYAFAWLKDAQLENKADLYAIWHRMKFVCQEVDQANARAFGHKIANLDDYISPETLEPLRMEMLVMLRKPSTPARIKNMLWKNYTHVRKQLGYDIEGIKMPEDERGMTKLAEELILMERIAFENDVLMGTTPISNRGRGKR
jgi:uncharacterized protein YbbK (DUF523 family)